MSKKSNMSLRNQLSHQIIDVKAGARDNENTKRRKVHKRTNVEERIANQKQEMRELYLLAFRKDFNASLNGSFKKQHTKSNSFHNYFESDLPPESENR